MLKDYLKSKDISVYKLAKESGIPYTTVLELTKNKTNVYKATVGTVKTLASFLCLSLDQFIAICEEKRIPFQEFRSSVCHLLKSKGDKKFVDDLLLDDSISHYFEYGWYEESLYLLGMLDYLKDINKVTKKDHYDELRNYKLEETIYPRDAEIMDALNKNKKAKKNAFKNSIAQFKKYNIVELDVRNVI